MDAPPARAASRKAAAETAPGRMQRRPLQAEARAARPAPSAAGESSAASVSS